MYAPVKRKLCVEFTTFGTTTMANGNKFLYNTAVK